MFDKHITTNVCGFMGLYRWYFNCNFGAKILFEADFSPCGRDISKVTSKYTECLRILLQN